MPLLFVLALGAAAAQASVPATEPLAEVKKLVDDCSAHRFETTISGESNGKLRESKVKICGKTGQTDAQWIATLKDAAAKVADNPDMPAASREQIILALNAEIARLGAELAATNASRLDKTPGLPAPVRPVAGADPQYSALPAFPPPMAAQPAPNPSGPAQIAAQPAPGLASAAPVVARLTRPRMAISCFSAGDIGGDGPCFAFDRNTRIFVRAGEPLNDISLRFIVGGERRADHALPALAPRRVASFALPRAVCSRAAGRHMSIEIVRGPAGKPDLAQVVGTEGPYNLTC